MASHARGRESLARPSLLVCEQFLSVTYLILRRVDGMCVTAVRAHAFERRWQATWFRSRAKPCSKKMWRGVSFLRGALRPGDFVGGAHGLTPKPSNMPNIAYTGARLRWVRGFKSSVNEK